MDDEYWAAFPDTMSTADVGAVVAMRPASVLVKLREGTIPGHFVARSWIMFKPEVRAWFQTLSNRPSPNPPPEVDVLAGYGPVLNYSDLMTVFGKTKPTIYRWLKGGTVPAYRMDESWIIHRTELAQMLEETSNRRAGYTNADVEGDVGGDGAEDPAPTTWLQKNLARIEGEVGQQEQQARMPKAE